MILDLELGEIASGRAEGLLFDGDKIQALFNTWCARERGYNW